MDRSVTRAMAVRPANEPEYDVVEVVPEDLERGQCLRQLEIDLGSMAIPRMVQWAEQCVSIRARSWPQSGARCTKNDITLHFA